jgi:hypothetical protein
MRLAWAPVAGAVALSLGAIAALLGAAATATVRRPGGIIRLLAESTGVGLVPVPAPAPVPPPPAACPPINYREPACDSARLRPPRPDATDAEVLEDMYHGLKCLEKAIVDPWAASALGGIAAAERRQLEQQQGGSRHFRCGGEGEEDGVDAMGPPPPSLPSNNASREEEWEAGWRAAAERQLCAVAGSMYDAMIACRHSLRRGMHVHSSGWVLIDWLFEVMVMIMMDG